MLRVGHHGRAPETIYAMAVLAGYSVSCMQSSLVSVGRDGLTGQNGPLAHRDRHHRGTRPAADDDTEPDRLVAARSTKHRRNAAGAVLLDWRKVSSFDSMEADVQLQQETLCRSVGRHHLLTNRDSFAFAHAFDLHFARQRRQEVLLLYVCDGLKKIVVASWLRWSDLPLRIALEETWWVHVLLDVL